MELAPLYPHKIKELHPLLRIQGMSQLNVLYYMLHARYGWLYADCIRAGTLTLNINSSIVTYFK